MNTIMRKDSQVGMDRSVPKKSAWFRYRYYIIHVLFPLDQLYYRSQFIERFPYKTGNRNGVAIISLVGFMILLIGLSNFTNIYLAVVVRRGREFGMKKVFGANGTNIFFQIWAENMFMVGMSLMVALLLIRIFGPLIGNVLQLDQIPFHSFDILLVLGLCGVIPLLASLFPYLSYNYRKPASTLHSVNQIGGKLTVRKSLLGFQYALTIVMIIVSMLFMKQFRFMTQKDLGFRTKDIIQISMRYGVDKILQQSDGDFTKMANSMMELIERKIEESPLFTHWTTTFSPRTTPAGMLTDLHLPGEKTPEVSFMEVDKDWFDIFELKLITGTLWDKKGMSPVLSMYDDRDSPTTNTNLIFTESALKAFGLTLSNYADASLENGQFVTTMRIAERMEGGGIKLDRSFGNLRIQGVVEDIYTDHLSKNFPPLIFIQSFMDKESFRALITASIVPGHRQEAVKYLHQVYEEIVGTHFSYTFFEDEIRAMYDEDRKIATTYSIFTAIAILISVMGLFSLSFSDIQQRRREVAIRKVNGATTGIILGMLFKHYIKLLGIAFAIAAPIGWLIIQRYLEGFAFKTAMSWWIFAVAFLVTAGISLLTLFWQTQKAATANPAEVIRN